MKKKVLALLLAGVMALSLAACGAGDDNAAQGSGKEIDGNVLDAKQTYNVIMNSDPSTMDVVKGNDTNSMNLLRNTAEPLTRLEEHDGKQTREAAGAESWESNEDGTVWTFHLRDNKWSDGQPVTAADYAYAMKKTLDPESGSPNSFFLACVKNAGPVSKGKASVDELGIKAVDDKTLEITLENPTPYFLALTDTRAMLPLRQDLSEKYGEKYGAELDTIVSCGPFKITQWTHNSELILEQNENYWDKENVNLTKITVKILQDENSIFNSFDTGAVDVTGVGTKEWMDRFDKKQGVTRRDSEKASVRFDFFNTKDDLFKNLNIRKAVVLAVDREDMVETIYQGAHYAAYGWVPPTVTTGELGEYRDQVEEPLKTMKENPKDLFIKGMEELGLGNDPSTVTFTYTMSGTTQWARNYCEYVQQVLEKNLGCHVELAFSEWGTFQQDINNGDYQMGNMVWGIDFSDPMAMLMMFKSGDMSVPTFWANEKYDALVDQAAVEMDEAKRVELYKEAEYVLFDEGCNVCPLVYEGIHQFFYDYVKNLSTMDSTTSGWKYIYISGRK